MADPLNRWQAFTDDELSELSIAVDHRADEDHPFVYYNAIDQLDRELLAESFRRGQCSEADAVPSPRAGKWRDDAKRDDAGDGPVVRGMGDFVAMFGASPMATMMRAREAPAQQRYDRAFHRAMHGLAPLMVRAHLMTYLAGLRAGNLRMAVHDQPLEGYDCWHCGELVPTGIACVAWLTSDRIVFTHPGECHAATAGEVDPQTLPAWDCAQCGQRNSGWSCECGRCELPKTASAQLESA